MLLALADLFFIGKAAPAHNHRSRMPPFMGLS